MSEKAAGVFENLCTTQIKRCVFRFKWTINDFSFYRNESERKIVSSIFSDGTDDGLQWRLEVNCFPKKYISRSWVYSMCLNLDLVSNNVNDIDAKCKFGILNVYLKEVNKTIHGFKFGNGNQRRLYIENFISKEGLFNEEDELLPNDALTIYCEINVGLCNENIPDALTIPASLVPNNLGLGLLENPEFSDITLCAGGKTIQAHKAILQARSSDIFRAMFQNDMKESQTNLVNTPDMDYEILEKILRFIYTDEFSDLHTVTDLMNLWSVADKYKLDRLKLRCEEKLGMNLSDQNAVECYIAADKANAEHLKASTKSYIITNVTRVAKTSGFALLVHNHPDLVAEVLSYLK